MKCPVWMGLWLGLLAAHIGTGSSATTRKYYLAVQEVLWDYTSGDPRNLLNLLDQATADIYVKQKADRVGSKYKKALYFQYTDATFSQEVVKSRHLGLTGPVLRGEVGDTLEVHFFNNASFVCSAHPHGLFYLKDSEAALYLDGTSGKWKNDEVVFPGAVVTLVWNITENDAPTAEDPNCIPWVYHSHVNTARDTSAGLIGTLVTCKEGILDQNNERTDVDVDIPLVVKIWDENLSWYIDDNMNLCLNPGQCETLSADGDADFVESNYMRAINGYMFGHLPDLQACIGKRAAFYVIGMGNEFDIHSLHFHGQNMAYQHTRGDTVSVFSATFVATETTPDTAGFWLISDMVEENTKRGMGAFLFTRHCTGSFGHSNATNRRLPPASGATRAYFLSAEEVTWNYGPSGFNIRTLEALNKLGTVSHTYFESSDTRIGGTYKKAMFKQYSDSTYSTEVQRSEDEKHMGILGPALRMEVGDILKVTLQNNVSFDVSFLPHALTFAFKQESVSGSGGGEIGPLESYTYTFHVPIDLLDGRTEPCHNFLYTSAHDLSRDHHTGLVGPLVVCKKGYLNGTGASNKKEFFMLLATFDENRSHYIDENIKMYINTSQDKSDEDFQKSNLMLSINGYSFGNLPTPKMCLGDDVTWYAMGLGITTDVHALAFDGNSFTEGGKHRDVEGLVPGTTVALRMTTDNKGTWGVQSQSDYALDNGMFGFYTVDSCNGSSDLFNLTGSVRIHYIAAEEVEWDYAPRERSLITGSDLNDPRREGNIFIKDDDDFIGDVYRKAVFRGYTDANFTQKDVTPQKYRHLDLLGPVIKAEVGDIIEVYFKNLATRPYSMHAHGLLYSDLDSGVGYGRSREVKPGEMKLYTWKVPERSGPAPNDPNCIPWLYYSAVDITRDTNSGLQGCIVICRPGTLGVISGDRIDVDSEFFIMMSVMNENFSWYLDENVKMYAKGRIGTDYSSDPDFEESNKMHAINGRVYGNAPDLVMEYNDTVAWYFLSLGGELDLHTAHLHGHTVIHTSERHRSDTLQMYPGMAEVVEMVADNPGTWLMHCHQLDHIIAGMETTYTVLQPGAHIPTDGASPNIHTG